MSISCKHCGQTWPRDPRLEVACPTCHVAVGSPCKRPSGHECPEPHTEREQLAIDRGFLTEHCPGPSKLSQCGRQPAKDSDPWRPQYRVEQTSLFRDESHAT